MKLLHTTRYGSRRTSFGVCLRCVIVLLASAVAVACGGDSPPPPPAVQLAFVTQPSETGALTIMAPPVAVSVTDVTGEVKDGVVSIAIDPNYCGANLSGTLSVHTQNGVAAFPDLSIDLLADGYALKATFESMTVASVPFNVTSTVVGASLTEHATLCLAPNEQGDAASLAYVPQDDAFWTTDDNLGAVHIIARSTGMFLDTIRNEEFLAAFPDVALCDDGDGNPATSCSYINEFEVATFDAATDSLYVINTVNDPMQVPPIDKPAIFRLIRQNCASCFVFDAWRALPAGFAYNGALVISGQLWVADGNLLYAYDFPSNTIDTGMALDLQRTIRGLAFDGSSLWAQYVDELREFAWPSVAELAQHDLNVFAVDDLSGLEIVGTTIYVLEGHGGNPIRRFTEGPPL